MNCAYLDWNATAPPLPGALDVMDRTARERWANPASVHGPGRHARESLEASRSTIARWLLADPNDIVFTSGGTEANNLALRSLCPQDTTLITSRIEHPSVTRVAEDMMRTGRPVLWIPVLPSGTVDVAALESALASSAPACVAVQAVNHETGVIQPIAEVIRCCKRAGARLHVDAVQAAGKIPVETWRGADTIAVAAHKIGGPKGIGLLLSGSCGNLQPLLLGGSQEGGIRPGTVSPVLAAGFAFAGEWAIDGPNRYASLRSLRDTLERELVALGGLVNGTADRVPHVVNVSFSCAAGDELVAALDLEGVAVSSGSACSAGTVDRSTVILAMLNDDRAAGAVRMSLGDRTETAEVQAAIAAWKRVIGRAGTMDEVLVEVLPSV